MLKRRGRFPSRRIGTRYAGSSGWRGTRASTGHSRRIRVEALVAPSTGPAWVTDLIHGDHSSGGSASLAAIAGYPHVTVPGGFVKGLPVGFSLFGTAWSEPRLLGFAYAFEQATRHRRPPEFKPSLGLAGPSSSTD